MTLKTRIPPQKMAHIMRTRKKAHMMTSRKTWSSRRTRITYLTYLSLMRHSICHVLKMTRSLVSQFGHWDWPAYICDNFLPAGRCYVLNGWSYSEIGGGEKSIYKCGSTNLWYFYSERQGWGLCIHIMSVRPSYWRGDILWAQFLLNLYISK